MNNPFRVMCIDDKMLKQHSGCIQPVYGEVYTVIEINHSSSFVFSGAMEGNYYKLDELPYQFNYHEKGFVPLSEIDETQMEREYNHQTQKA